MKARNRAMWPCRSPALLAAGMAIAALPCIAGGQSVPAKNPTVLHPRQPTVVVAPNGTQPASPRRDTPLQQPSTPSALPGQGAAIAAADVKTEEIRCKGGPMLLFESKGSKMGPTGAGLTDLIFSPPHPNAQGIFRAAGADGAWLETGTCAFAERAFVPGSDPQAIRYESSGPADGNPQGQLQQPDQYWRFNVYKTSYGHFYATSHGVWKPVVARLTPKEWDSPADGGPGGYPFHMRCDAGFYLAGMRVRVGHDIDAISPVCARMFPDGARAELDPRENWTGGQGGQLKSLVCPQLYPFVRWIVVESEGIHSVILNSVQLNCSTIVPPGTHGADLGFPIAAQGPSQRLGPFDDGKTFDIGGGPCPEGMTAAGVHGRSGTMVHALGPICREIVGLKPQALVAGLHVAGLPVGSSVSTDAAVSEDAPRIGDRQGLERAPPVIAPPQNPPPGTPPEQDADDHVVGISGVKIKSGLRAVDFRFDARPSASPYVELSLKAPVVQSNGQAGLKNAMRLKAYRVPATGSATVARYTSSSSTQGLMLAQATTYHYVIVVPAQGKAKEQRASGSFTTRSQRRPAPARASGGSAQIP